jgi:hypothetical protein
MTQQAGATASAPPKIKTKGGVPYRVERRTTKKGGAEPLSAFAIDITIRVNGQEAYFLQDHNSTRNVMPHNNRKELVDTLVAELERNHSEHFGHP